MLDLFGYIGYSFIFYGLFKLANREISGWLYRIIGESIWTVLGFIMGMSSIWVCGLIFLFLDTRGYLKWKKESNGRIY